MASQAVTQLLRPFQQTATWTFALALLLLKSAPEHAASDALDEFLAHNTDVILLPVAFARCETDGKPKFPALDPSKHEFTLRGVLFSGITSRNVRMAQELASFLAIHEHEALRIVIQTDKRKPEPGAGDMRASRLLFGGPAAFSAVKSTHISSDSSADRNRFLLYVKAALKERRAVLRIASECFNTRNVDSVSSVVRNLGKSLVVSDAYVLEAVDGLGSLMSLLSTANATPDALETLLRDELFLHTMQLLQLIFDVLLSSVEILPKFASAWFQLMRKTAFVLTLAPFMLSKNPFSVLHGLATVVSLQIFDLHGLDSKHLDDPQLFTEINTSITAQSPNNILRYAWLILLYKKSILLEEFPSTHENFLLVVPLTSTQNDIARLQNALQNAPVFAEIVQLNRVLSFDNVFAVILSDLIVAAIPLIHSTDDIVSCISQVLSSAPNTSVEKFFDDDAARQLIVLARAKFPFAIGPYLKLASINGNFALHELEELSSYMSVFSKSEFSALYDVDSDNTDLVRLTLAVEVFPPFEPAGKLSLFLDKGTKAQVFHTADENLVLVTFLHRYNGWTFLGRAMENISKFFDIAQKEKTAALESILDLLVRATVEDPSSASFVLECMSTYTDDSDIVDVLFRVFEQSMHNRSVVLLEKVLRLFANLMPVIPSRIWPYLSTSSLLPNKGKEGFLSILFGSIETAQGDYRFTNALVKFVFSLADNCLSVTKDYSADAKSDIFATFIEHTIQVFENYNTSKFNDSFQKFELGVLILDVFTQTLETIYSIGPIVKVEEKPTRVFAKASKKILDAFLSTTTLGYARSSSLIIDLIDSLACPSDSFDARDISGFLGDVWIHLAFSFAKLLVTIRSITDSAPSKFEETLFLKLPQLVTIYSDGGPLRKVVLDLLTALTSGKWEAGRMPSILSHLGQDHSRILLHSLAIDLETSFDDYSIKISIYDFLCSIMEANQQGLSVLFISGRNVFCESAEAKDTKDHAQTTSLLSIMKRNVHDVKFYPPTVTVHLLDAISLAFNSWTTARSDDSDVLFVKELVSMLETFTKGLDAKDTSEIILTSYHCKVYAKIAEILSLVLFTTKNEKCVQSIQALLSLAALTEKLPGFFAIQDYDNSLYDTVKRQFESEFQHHRLTDFAVAIKKRNRFGSSMVYDLLLLDSFFQRNPKWSDIRDQVVYLSANMQYYSAQFSLSKSMGALLTAFCRRTPTSVPKEYSKVIHGLLSIKEPEDSYTKPFASEHYYERIELAFLILFTVNNTADGKKALVSYAMPIIEACSELMESSRAGYLSSSKDDFSYRSLLRIVYIALSNLRSFEVVNTRMQALFKLFEYVVSKGTTSIIIELQNDVYLARTNKNHKAVNLGGRLDDLRLILSVLNVFVQLEVTSYLQAECSSSLIKQNTVDTLLSLYSFSHLILVNNEPIFAQLSLMFIQQLLLVEHLADKVVESKLFVVIRESMISQPLRNGGISIANSPQLHGNWTKGILPILFSFLSRGKAISESVLTLRAFSKQIEYSIDSWSNDSSALQVSSASTFETLQVLYIFQILMSIATAQGLKANHPTDIDMPVLPGLDTRQKRDDFVGFVGNLLKHPKFLKSRVYPSTMEEEALMKADGREYETFVKGLIEDIKELKEFLV